MCATRGTLTQVTLTQITLPNAIVGPGYTFVPGVGILGASCDLPTSACTNEYRDVK
jgi:hypothetical protein